MMLANSTAGDKAVDYFHREIQALQSMLMPEASAIQASSSSMTCFRLRVVCNW